MQKRDHSNMKPGFVISINQLISFFLLIVGSHVTPKPAYRRYDWDRPLAMMPDKKEW